MKSAINKKKIALIVAACASVLLIIGTLCGWLVWRSNHKPAIALEQKSIALDVTDTLLLKAQTKNTRKKVVWTSSNDDVAVVEKGVVTALKAGEATITASVAGESATCMVTVTDSHSAPVMSLNYNNVSLGLDKSISVQVKTYWKGEEVKEGIEYQWELADGYSSEIASMQSKKDSAVVTGKKFGDTAFIVSATYRGTVLVKRLSVCVCDIDVIFDSPNMGLAAGCYTVNLGLLDTKNDVTSILPEIYVYDKETLVKNPVFTWKSEDPSIATVDEKGRITAKQVGSTMVIGVYGKSQIRILVNVYRSKITMAPLYLEQIKDYKITLANLKGTTIEDAFIKGNSVLYSYSKATGTIQLNSKKLPGLGLRSELTIQTPKAEYIAEVMVVTMLIDDEKTLNEMPKAIAANEGKGYYILGKDIVCKGTYDGSGGTSSSSYNFKGTFDGQGYTIHNMSIGGKRTATDRGLVGGNLSNGGIVKNVSFVNASHFGRGGFIAGVGNGTIENVYIQITMGEPYAKNDVAGCALTALVSSSQWYFKAQNVIVEYKTPLPEDAGYGYALMNLENGGRQVYEGLYAIGAPQMAQKSSTKMDLVSGENYAAYLNYADFVNAGIDLSTWDSDFWSVTNGIPYPKKLAARKGTVPSVTVEEYASPGTKVTVEGATVYDRIVLDTNAAKLGVTVKGNELFIPSHVTAGTTLTFTVQSIFDSAKKVTLKTQVMNTKHLTIENYFGVEVDGADTFTLDLSAKKNEIGNAVVYSALLENSRFQKPSYKDGILTLDRATLNGLGEQKATIKFVQTSEKKVIILSFTIDVCTLCINSEGDLNAMPYVIKDNNGKGRYILGKDIVCSGTYNGSAGVSQQSYQFTGTFEGHGHTIENLSIGGNRTATNRGLIGNTLGYGGIVKNVSFVNASHFGRGGLIAGMGNGTIENVYVQITMGEPYAKNDVAGCALTALVSNSQWYFKATNVLVEYKTPLPENAGYGYALMNLENGGRQVYDGVYAIGASQLAQKSSTNMNLVSGDNYAAYTNYADFLNAGIDLSTWDSEFWSVTGGIPYPKNLAVRKGDVPNVTVEEYVAPGTKVKIGGITIYDKVILSSDMVRYGIKVENNQLVIPNTVPLGTKMNFTVASVFDANKKVTLGIEALTTVYATLTDTYQIETYENKETFTIDFGTQKDVVGNAVLQKAKIDETAFVSSSYTNGILTLDYATLNGNGAKTVTVTFKDPAGKLIVVTAKLEVYTMVINDEAELNMMPATLVANQGKGHYILGNDIVCSGTYNGSGGTDASYEFKGTFDGQGYAIHNMSIGGNRTATNRGLVGGTLGNGGIVKNVSFVNASHYGRGGFIAGVGNGTIENVYIQITMGEPYAINDVAGCALTALVSSSQWYFKAKNVIVEYKTPLPENAGYGYALMNLDNGGRQAYDGLYVIGASQVAQKSPTDMNLVYGSTYGAYATYGDFLNAGIELDKWDTEFWNVTGGLPYPKKLSVREGVLPTVNMNTTVLNGTIVTITGATMYDRIILSEGMAELGILVKNNRITIPNTVPAGTKIGLTIQSAFDSSKEVSYELLVQKKDDIILQGVFLVGTEDNENDTFTIDFGTQKELIGNAQLLSVLVGGNSFDTNVSKYENGVLTLDKATLKNQNMMGQQSFVAVFQITESHFVHVTINVEVYTMVIDSWTELKRMPTVLTAQAGEGHYILDAHIKCTETYDGSGRNGAYGVEALYTFKGTFDGRGYTISDLTIGGHQNNNGAGFVGTTMARYSVVKNVAFKNVSRTGSSRGGMIAATSQGKIENVYFEVSSMRADADATKTGNNAMTVLISNPAWYFEANQVIVEYKTSWTNTTYGQAFYTLALDSKVSYDGVYVIGANQVFEKTSTEGNNGGKRIYGAYADWNAFKAANQDVSTWSSDYWTVTEGKPTWKNLPVK